MNDLQLLQKIGTWFIKPLLWKLALLWKKLDDWQNK